jgi:hypothetical protein
MTSCTTICNEDIAVGIAKGCRLEDRLIGVRVTVESRAFSYGVQTAVGAHQSPIQRVLGALYP